MQLQIETAHPVTNAPPSNQKTDSENTPAITGVKSDQIPGRVFHLFDSPFPARRFQKLSGESWNNIIEHSYGWHVGKNIPANATCYLWPLDDACGELWVRELAASTKATLKRPGMHDGCLDVEDLMRGDESDDLIKAKLVDDLGKAMSSSEAVPNTNDRTGYDDLLEIKKKADALTEAEYRAALRKNDIAWFHSGTKHHTEDELLQALADRPRLKYEHLRESCAKRLDCRPQVLDKLVDERRLPSHVNKTVAPEARPKPDSTLQGSAVLCPDVEPYPEAVDVALVLNETTETIAGYISLSEWEARVVALWCAHTHYFQLFECSPRLNITSPERGCGKTTLRDVVALFVPRPLCLENLTSGSAIRLAEKYSPVILADEYDAWLRDNQELRGLLNAGHRKGGVVVRCEGDNNEPRLFRVYTPAVLCGIGDLPDTLGDRSIVIKLARAKPGELKARFDSRRTDKEKELCRKLARLADDNRERLTTADPVLPEGAHNRVADNWRPLFAIAELAGGDWPEWCKDAYVKLTSQSNDSEQGIRIDLLSDIRQVFKVERIFSRDLCDLLAQLKDRRWPDVCRGKPINERWLALRLGDFDIHSKTLRIEDDQAKGYELADFQDAFERYLLSLPRQEGDSIRPTVPHEGKSDFFYPSQS